jgi:two-component system LytT family response regulator
MSEKLQTLIIEDEELARNLLRSYLKDQPNIEIIGECENGFDGVKAINEKKPDLVFLDIQMPKITGFEMIELLDYKPQIIFTTAYDQYALKAFELNAVDYLLKPFSKERMQKAIEKVVHHIQYNENNLDKLDEMSNFRPDEQFIDRVVVKDRHKIHIITVDKIRYIESLDDYVMIYTHDGRHMKQKTMKYFETYLDPNNFIRIHRSYIVQVDNIAEIQQYEKESYVVILKDKDKTKLKVSKSGYKKIKEVLHF